MNLELYANREQTYVKHLVLNNYLQRFAHIIGSAWGTITYVDCFSGPWKHKDENLSDTSPAIAIARLKEAKNSLATRNPMLKLRCFFIESNPEAFALLREFTSKQSGVEIGQNNGEFLNSIPQIQEFVRRGGSRNFSFFFIDPCGWAGIDPDEIKPLITMSRSTEVLVNYMTSHIRRRLDDKECEQRQIAVLFDSVSDQERACALTGDERDDAIVDSYCRKLKRVGDFLFVAPMVVANPHQDRSHFHLIYATRNRRGVEVFKEIEKSSFPQMDNARITAEHRKRTQDGQRDLFEPEILHGSNYLQDQRSKFNEAAKTRLHELLTAKSQCDYSDLYLDIMRFPLTWNPDLQDWIWDLKKNGFVTIEGLSGKEHALLRDTPVRISRTTSFK